MESFKKYSKGKPVTTSVPSIAIRFHTSGEELEEFYLSETEGILNEDVDDGIKTSNDDPSGVTNVDQSNDQTKRESSPIKEVFSRLGKRSTSVDIGINSLENTSAASNDRWRIFSEIKGKLTKTVEEKISEMKSGSKNSEHERSKEKHESRTSLLNKFHSSKDNSSISDSEDISASESSTSKFADVEMSSNGTEDETASQGSDIIGSLDIEKQKSTDTEKDVSDVSPKKNVIRNRFKSLPKLKEQYSSSPVKNTKSIKVHDVNVKVSYKNNTNNKDVATRDMDIESGVEICEDFTFSPNTNIIETAIREPMLPDNNSVQMNTSNLKDSKQKQPTTQSIYCLLYNFKFILCIVLLNVFYVNIPLPSYLKGFLTGSTTTLFFCWMLYKFYVWLNSNIKQDHPLLLTQDNKEVSILEVRAVKEYQPIYKFEGWMNEYPYIYDASTYHIAATRSVWVCLEGSQLKISSGRDIRVSKRAMWNESVVLPGNKVFTSQRKISMKGAKVKLLPEGLTRKRFWSKKYPICIEFNKESKYLGKIVVSDKDDSDQTVSTAVHVKKNLGEKTSDGSKIERNELNELTNLNADNCDQQMNSDLAQQTHSFETELDLHSQNDLNGDHLIDNYNNSLQYEIEEMDDNSVTEMSTNWDTDLNETSRIYLFTRTDRDKEEWYNRFVGATHYNDQKDFMPTTSLNSESDLSSAQSANDTPEAQDTNQLSSDANKNISIEISDNKMANESFAESISEKENIGKTEHTAEMENYLRFMNKLTQNKLKKEEIVDSEQNSIQDEPGEIIWMNALIGRILYDTMQELTWINALQQRIQRKLSSIKLPYFLEELIISELELGTAVPIIQRISKPVIDSRGLWIDLDITYEGSMRGTLETKFNLMKLKRVAGQGDPEDKPGDAEDVIPTRDPVYDSDMDDSAESSSEDDVTPAASMFISVGGSEHVTTVTPSTPSSTGATGKKILRMVDKIAASKYFQQAAENKYIKRAMEGVSRTELKLYVEVRGLVGTLAVNIPPPPSHRIWLGFRTNPKVCLHAYPVVGERSFNFNQISSWIEKKLEQEFQKILVLPNMEDFVIPIMNQKLPE